MNEFGFSCYRVQNAFGENEYLALLNGTRAAKVNCESLFLEASIFQGKEAMQPVLGPGFRSEDEPPGTRLWLGERARTDFSELRLIETQTNRTRIVSTVDKPSGRYHYYTPQTGGVFVYLLAELKNSGSHAINPCNIYVEATVDHTYIKGFAYAAKKNAEYFLTELTPEGSCYVFLGADVQRSLLKNAQEVRIRFEFTPEFDLPVQETHNRMDFTNCEYVYEVFVL